MKSVQTEYVAMAVVAIAGLAWGLFWIPLRALDAGGIEGVWAVVLFYALPAAFLFPVLIWRSPQIMRGGWPLQIAGILTGMSLVLYAGAVMFTDVVRALLLFYMTPLWSTLLARAVTGEPITPQRWGTMGLALLGLLLILRVDEGLDMTFNTGDWMGLLSGLIWAAAAVYMNGHERGSGVDFTLTYFVWGSLFAFALTLFPLAASQPVPDSEALVSALPWFVPVALILIIPPAFAVMWGATILSPGLLGVLFMTEVSAGAITAAIWAGEPFGWREALGVILITAAGAFEPVIDWLRPRTPEVS